MDRKIDIIFKIGSLFSFFLLGVDSMPVQFRILYIPICIVILICVICIVYIFFNQKKIDIKIYVATDSIIELTIINNSNYIIEPSMIVFFEKNNIRWYTINLFKVKIPPSERYKGIVSITKKKKNNYDKPTDICIEYLFDKMETKYTVERKMTKKEIKMLQKIKHN